MGRRGDSVRQRRRRTPSPPAAGHPLPAAGARFPRRGRRDAMAEQTVQSTASALDLQGDSPEKLWGANHQITETKNRAQYRILHQIIL